MEFAELEEKFQVTELHKLEFVERILMINRDKVKEIMKALGADLCGIASIDRFEGAPEGYHPLDVFPACKSVISFGCRFPVGTLFCESHTPYTQVRNTITPKMDMIALNFCMEMERHGIMCVPKNLRRMS